MKQTRIWLLALGLLALLSVGGLFIIQALQEDGDRALVYQDGALILTLPLDVDTEVPIDGPKGGYNVVRVSAGTVAVSEANCPDQICVHRGATRQTRDPITCLPHRLTVEVVLQEGNALDGVSA